MKRFLMLLAAGVAAVAIGCTASTPATPVADAGDTAAKTTPDDTGSEVRTVSLNVPNMT